MYCIVPVASGGQESWAFGVGTVRLGPAVGDSGDSLIVFGSDASVSLGVDVVGLRPTVEESVEVIAFGSYASVLQSRLGSMSLFITASSNGVERSAIRSPVSSCGNSARKRVMKMKNLRRHAEG